MCMYVKFYNTNIQIYRYFPSHFEKKKYFFLFNFISKSILITCRHNYFKYI
uniref:Uncharacterized protein n=1 Tax=Octopus bimaculoides TaxID=37653 RepID=A0A0L8HVR2_OCTBM